MKIKNLLMIAITAFGIATTASAQVPNYVPTNGLVGWWPFNGNANDESGNGNNGTVNGATLATDRFGAVDKAYDFDGVDDIIIVTNENNFDLQQGISISVWIKKSTMSSSSHIISKFQNYDDSYSISTSNTKFEFQLAQSPTAWTYFTSNSNVDTSWTKILVTRDFISSQVKLYVNGILDTVSVYTPLIANSQAPLTFGDFFGNNFSPGSRFDGVIDDIGIWNRALNQQEITALYNSTLGLPVSINETSIKLYPNPTNSSITLEVSLEKIGKSYSILDFSGRTIRDGKISSAQEQIDLQGVARGVYYLSIENGSSVIKLVKQ